VQNNIPNKTHENLEFFVLKNVRGNVYKKFSRALIFCGWEVRLLKKMDAVGWVGS
jgi:hypothetical protein